MHLVRQLAVAALATHLLAPVAGAERVSVVHSEPLRGMTLQTAAAAIDDADRLAGTTTIRFDALGRRFELDLQSNSALLTPAARAALGERTGVYRGRLRGVDDSWVRIVMHDGVPSGMLFDGDQMLAIESGVDPADPGARIFRLADVVIEPGTMSCGAGSGAASGAELFAGVVAEMRTALQRGPGAVEEIEIGAISDEEFTAAKTNPEQAILTRLNNVDGIYSSELGIQITVPLVEVFDAQDDPFTDTTDSGDLVDELRSYRSSNAAQSSLGLTHLFTGRDLDGTTVGIAFVGALCRPSFGAGLTQATSTITTDSLVAAHEIGHNFGANHDGDAAPEGEDPQDYCPDEPDDQFIMAPRVSQSPQFSECSKQVMLRYAAAASCITPLPATDPTITSFGEPETALLGNIISLNFDVDNRGSIDAENVGVEITLPANVTLVSAATQQQACTSGASVVSCAIGTLAGSSSQVVSISASADAVGDASFTATVSGTPDDNLGNNVDTHVVTIEPAVNLVANQPATAQVTIDSARTVSVTIDNTSILEATGVTIVATVDAGLRTDSVSWTAGDCTIDAGQIDCSATSVAAQSTSTLSFTVTGVTLGSQGYTVTLASNEQDANSADNVISGTVTVVSASTGNNDDGGGGSTGLMLLAVLAALRIRGRQSR
ncbi:MAG: M12 family metallo-peptidase [Woeseiaceae bacterium]|nr:M12 family metallo-peptidase [Woeseiaceae bacterium]